MSRPPSIAAALFALALGACSSQGPAPMPGPEGVAGVVSGTVTYRERMALPPDAVVEVWITDVTPGVVTNMALLGEATVQSAGRQVPIPFEIRFEPARVAADHLYAVKAAIRGGGQTLFESEAGTNVITRGNPMRVELRLTRFPAGGPTGQGGGLGGTKWVLTDLAGAGMIGSAQATLEFAGDGKVSGAGSCNRFFGSMTLSGETIGFSRVGSTMMACSEASMNQEQKYLSALQKAQRFSRNGAELLIYSEGLVAPLKFAQQKP